MKDMRLNKILLAVAALAASAAASAQSSVTLFGVVDTTLNWTRSHGSAGAHRFQLTNAGYNTSRIGFRGSEDLGGGMFAAFWLEAGLSSDDGNAGNAIAPGNQASLASTGLNFGRRATVSLGGNWGEARLGRDYTPQYFNLAAFDPFTINGAGTNVVYQGGITGVTQVRASNTISYLLPPGLGGIYGEVQYYAGENLSTAGATADDGSGGGVRVGYSSGPLNIAVATGHTHYAAGNVNQSNIGAQWSFGFARVMALAARDSRGSVDARGWSLGTLVPVGPGEIRLAYSRYDVDPGPRFAKWAVGYVHHLSKRTALYTTYARLKNSEEGTLSMGGVPVSPNNSVTAVDLGIRHSF
jgi:predicted porin